ncbi:MAG: rhomboid family intramembrane serine protease [Oscillospiraceae bacterium]|jgi:membrane associated rhomboid family serine protease|nr:rhomboid family intramembrane serine protease [Oscillospiraceae bacterium]
MKRIKYNAPVTLTFALVSLLALLLGMLTKDYTTRLLFSVYRSPLRDIFTYPRLFLHVLGHSGWQHYIGNMLMLLVLGPSLEEKYGARPMIFAIVITALVTGVVEWAFFPGTALLGASGIVFMMIVLSSLAGRSGGSVPLTLILVVALYLGREVLNGLTVKDNVSQLTHIVGGICGAVIGISFSRRRK